MSARARWERQGAQVSMFGRTVELPTKVVVALQHEDGVEERIDLPVEINLGHLSGRLSLVVDPKPVADVLAKREARGR